MGTIVCLGMVIGIFLGDLRIKNYIERNMEEGDCRKLAGGRLIVRKHHNRGAVLNLGQSRRAAVAALSVVMTAAAFVVFLFSLGQRGNSLLRTGLSLVLGGAFSNTYDRLRRKYVVDYVSFGVRWKRFRRMVFNLSDFCIITGALLAALGAGR